MSSKKKDCEVCQWNNSCDYQDFKGIKNCQGANIPVIGNDLADFWCEIINERD